MTVPRVCAVVLNAAGAPLLLDCLRSLGKVVYENLDIIVVRNGPRDDALTAEARNASGKVSDVLFTGFNAGFAAGNNPGIKLALGKGVDYVLLLNDDTAVAPDFLSMLAAEALKIPAAGMLGPRVFYFSEPGRIFFSGARFDAENCGFAFPGADQEEASYGRMETAETDYVTGCAVLVSRRLIETVGLLDERYFLYWEDADWGLRASAAGFKSLVVPAAKIWHKVSVSSGGSDSLFKIYHKTRGHFLFARLHAPAAARGLAGRFLRDAAWLVFKSRQPGRFKKAAAYLAGMTDYFLGRTGPGPAWLRR